MVQVKKDLLPPKRIPMKYCSRAIIPDELVIGDSRSQPYILLTGQIVTFDFFGTYDNRRRMYPGLMERASMFYHGVPFDTLESAWRMRLGHLSGWWHGVILVNYK